MRRVAYTAAFVLVLGGIGIVASLPLQQGDDPVVGGERSSEQTATEAMDDSSQGSQTSIEEAVYDARVPLCGKTEGAQFCVKDTAARDLDAALSIFDKSGPAEALDYLLEKLEGGAEWSQQCHQMIHIIGHEAARLYPIADVVAVDNRMCQDGYLDGAMEGFSDYSNDEDFWKGIAEMCVPMIEAQDAWKATSCAHSIGHAIAFRGVGNYREAVRYCDAIPEMLRNSCGGGAIMGIVNPVEGSAVSDLGLPVYSTLDPEIIDATCTGIDLVYAEPCLSIQWTMYPGDWGKEELLSRLRNVCPGTISPFYCFDGYGSALYQKTLPTADERGETAQEIYEVSIPLLDECYELVKEGIPGCVQGVTYSAVWWYTTVHSSGDGYISMCPAVRPAWRDKCVGSERTVLSGY